MTKNRTYCFCHCLPESSAALIREVARRIGISERSFVMMAALRYAAELKHEFDNAEPEWPPRRERQGAVRLTWVRPVISLALGRQEPGASLTLTVPDGSVWHTDAAPSRLRACPAFPTLSCSTP